MPAQSDRRRRAVDAPVRREASASGGALTLCNSTAFTERGSDQMDAIWPAP
jgi:hypothetical protein